MLFIRRLSYIKMYKQQHLLATRQQVLPEKLVWSAMSSHQLCSVCKVTSSGADWWVVVLLTTSNNLNF